MYRRADLYADFRGFREKLASQQIARHEEGFKPEKSDLQAYAGSEGERIKSFIAQYEQQAAGEQVMQISIQNQRQRLEQLESRFKQRTSELERRGQMISLAPEVEAWSVTLSVV